MQTPFYEDIKNAGQCGFQIEILLSYENQFLVKTKIITK
jgi:hypothetical protein